MVVFGKSGQKIIIPADPILLHYSSVFHMAYPGTTFVGIA